jgi:hypothetical protein
MIALKTFFHRNLTYILTHPLGDFNNRGKEIEYPSRGVDSNPTHHVPETTDINYGSKGDNDDVLKIMNTKNDERPTSFFAQPGILAGEYLMDFEGALCLILGGAFAVKHDCLSFASDNCSGEYF